MKKLFLLGFISMNLTVFAANTEITMYTNMGNIVLEMEDSLAPHTAFNFRKLVKLKFYDGIIFHRVIDNFMIQGGDPNGNGTGGPGYAIQDEFHVDLSNVQATISMANSGPNTGGSQFFINLVNNTQLDFNKTPYSSKHAVFGRVISGFNIVQDIGKVATDGSDKPLNDVVMDSVRVTSDPLVGIEAEPKVAAKLKLSPNPINKSTTLEISSTISHSSILEVIDITGRVIASKTVHLKTGVQNIVISEYVDIDSLKAGIYLIRLDAETIKFIK